MKICRICGCTDNDCSQCIDIQGEACYWITDDLCSRCAVCENCGTNKEEDEVRISTIWWTDGEKHEGIKLLCDQCENELYERCDYCEAIVDRDCYGNGIPDDYNGSRTFCPECAAKKFPICKECGDLVLSVKQELCVECFDEKYGENE